MAQSGFPFDPKSYYRFANAKYAGVTISTGYIRETSNIIFTPLGSRSSENWQLYQQAGRYFIRNYDYGGRVQLGLTKSSPVVPQLLPRSGDLGQQWLLSQNADGSWRVINALYGNATILGVSDGISNTVVAPGMNPSPDGSDRWIITVNLSAGEIREKAMLEDVQNVQPLPSPVPIISSSAPVLPSISSAPATLIPSIATTTLSVPTTAVVSSTSSGASSTLPAFSSQAQSLRAPIQFHNCATVGAYVAFSGIILFLVAGVMLWKQRQHNAYRPIADSDVEPDLKRSSLEG